MKSFYKTLMLTLALCLSWAVNAQVLEGFESGSLPTGWTDTSTSASDVWWEVSSSASHTSTPHTGSYMVVMNYNYGRSGETAILTSPVVDLSNAVLPRISFWYVNPLWSPDQNTLVVKYTTDGTNWITAGTYDTDVTTWTEVNIILPATEASSTFQVRFEGTDNYGYPICLDDIIISSVSCLPPSDLALEAQVTALTAVWTAGDSESEWEVSCTDGDTTFVQIVNNESATFFDLDSATTYQVSVRAICSPGDTSFAINGSIRTLCYDFIPIPFVENFDQYPSNTTPFCGWGVPYSTSASDPYPYVSTYYGRSGQGLYMYSYQTSVPASTKYAMGPIDPDVYSMDELMISFWMQKTTTYSYDYYTADIVVGVMSDPSDWTTFYPVDTLSTSENTWTYKEVYFNNLPESIAENAFYVAFVSQSITGSGSTYYYNYVAVDDVTIKVLPECNYIFNAHVDAVSAGSVLVGLDIAPVSDNDNNIFVQVSDTVSFLQTFTFQSDERAALISGLTPGTSYNVAAWTECSGEPTDTVYTSFSTYGLPCAEIDTTDSDTIAIGTGGSTSSYLPSYSLYSYGLSEQIYLASEVGGGGIIYGLQFQMSSVVQTRGPWRIYLGTTSQNNMSSMFTPDGLTLVFDGAQDLVLDTNTFIFDQPYNFDGDNNLVVVMFDDYGSWSSGNASVTHSISNMACYKYQDGSAYGLSDLTGGNVVYSRMDMQFFTYACSQLASCAAPLGRVTNVTSDSIYFYVAPGYQESSWDVEYRVVGDSAWTYAYNTSSNENVLGGLTPLLDYQIRIYSCSDDAYSTILNAHTSCGDITVPYYYDFEDDATNTTTIECWTHNGSYYMSNVYITAPGVVLDIVDNSHMYQFPLTCSLALPRVDEEVSLDTCMLRLRFLAAAAGVEMAVGVCTDPTDMSTFTSFDTLVSEGANSTFFTVRFNNWQPEMGRYIALQSLNNYAYIDDIMLIPMPQCPTPDSVMASNITLTSADITWQGTNDSYILEYGPLYMTPGTGTMVSVANTTYSLTGLNPGEGYTVLVYGVCNEDTSFSSSTYTFHTQCTYLTIPYVENFDDTPLPPATYTLTLPNCWTDVAIDYTQDLSQYHAQIFNDAYYSTTGNNYLYFNYGGTVALPELAPTQDITDLQISFDLYKGYYDGVGIVMGVMTDPSDPTTFVAIDTLQNEESYTYERHTSYFAAYQGTGKFIALRAYSATGSYSYLYIAVDSIVVEQGPSCYPVRDLAVTQDTGSLNLSWREIGNATSWEVAVNTTDDLSSATISTVSATNFVDTNVAAGNFYYYWVRSMCGAGDTGMWVGPVSTALGLYNMQNGVDTLYTCAAIICDDGGLFGNYSANFNGDLVIYPATPGNLIAIQGHVVIECSSYDKLYIYDGDNTSGTLLVNLSGTSFYSGIDIEAISTTGPLTIHFESDASVQYDGFALNVSCASNTCPLVQDITLAQLSTNNATFTWTPGGEEAEWEVSCNGVTTVVTSPLYTVTGLDSLTPYTFYVRPICSEGDTGRTISYPFTSGRCDGGCLMSIVMTDGFGDGWNGAGFNLNQGSYSEFITLANGEDGVADIQVCPVDSLILTWRQGSFDNEIAFIVIDPAGDTLSECYFCEPDESEVIAAFIPECPLFCTAPTVSASNITYDAATITWTGSASSYEYSYKANDNANWPEATLTNDYSFTLSGLDPETSYQVRVRSICEDDVYSDWTTISFTTDELPCMIPEALTATEVTGTTATLTWNAISNETSWEVRYAAQGDTTFVNANATTTTITGLFVNVTYTAWVRALCGDGTVVSDWSEPVEFTTTPCPMPTNVTANDVTTTGATISWTAPEGYNDFTLYYGITENTNNMTPVEITGTSHTLSGLESNTTYYVSISTRCAEGWVSDLTANISFRTTVGINDVNANSVSLYPNPATTQVTIEGYEGEVQIVDMTGRVVLRSNDTTIDISTLTAGAYFVKLGTTVKKLIVK